MSFTEKIEDRTIPVHTAAGGIHLFVTDELDSAPVTRVHIGAEAIDDLEIQEIRDHYDGLNPIGKRDFPPIFDAYCLGLERGVFTVEEFKTRFEISFSPA